MQTAMVPWDVQFANAFRCAPFPLYGLPPSWEGVRFLGGSGVSRSGSIQRLELAHGDPRMDDEPEVRVESSLFTIEGTPPAQIPAEVLEEAVWDAMDRSMAFGLFHLARRPPGRLDPEELRRWVEEVRQYVDAGVTPAATLLTVAVDGRWLEFRGFVEGECWVASTRMGDLTVKVTARSVALGGIELARIDDPEPYIRGYLELHDQWNL